MYLSFKCYPLSWDSPLEYSSPISPPPASIRMFSLLSTNLHLTTLASTYTEEVSLHRNKDFSYGCQTMPSSATYAAGAMAPSMYTLWLVV